MKDCLNKNREFIPWIIHQRSLGAEVASLCGGAFLLAETGLLDNKAAATHWSLEEEFTHRYPNVELQPNKVMTENQGIYTSGGAYTFLNLLLHLVQKYNGKEVAIWCSKMFEVDYGRDSQSPFIIFQGQKSHADEIILKAQKFIESHIGQKYSIESLASKYSLSTRSFIRRFKKATHNTPIEYIQRVRIEKVKKLLETTDSNVSEAMFEVGYSDMKSFRSLFKKLAGMTPNEYRLKYNIHEPAKSANS